MSRPFVALAVAACLAAALFAAPLAQRSPVQAPDRSTIDSDGHPMAVWSRVPESPRGVVLLLHGRTWSSRPDFDLQVPGLERSVMRSLADRGFATYAVDLRGYGETPRDETGWLTPRRSMIDVMNVVAWLREKHADLPAPALIGWSRGGAIAHLVAQAMPDRLSALVIFGFVFDPDADFVDGVLPEEPGRLANTESSARSDFISPDVTPPAVVQAFVAQALAADPVLADLRADGQFNGLRPADVTVPTLVMYGARDPGVVQDTAGRFFARLGTSEKQMVVLPGADHAAQLEDTHDAWIAAVVNFMTRPGAGRWPIR